MENITSWGQFGLCVAGATALIVFSVGHLFRTMSNAYGGIVAALQNQNQAQQKQIDSALAHASECDERLARLRCEHDELRNYAHERAHTLASAVQSVQHDTAVLKKQVNGGSKHEPPAA